MYNFYIILLCWIVTGLILSLLPVCAKLGLSVGVLFFWIQFFFEHKNARFGTGYLAVIFTFYTTWTIILIMWLADTFY